MQFLSKVVGGRPVILVVALLGASLVVGCASSSPSSNVTATPSFSPGAGSYNTSQTVTIADSTKGAVLYCTTDGTPPTTSSPQCSQPTTVFKTEFLQAMAVAPGMDASAVASAGYTINLSAAATPTFSPAGGAYAKGQAVVIADATAGANIFYTTDGSVPTASSTLYTGPLTLSKAQTISAIAVASGLSNSGVASAAYTLAQAATATPAFSVPAGSYTSAQTVAISDATAGAAIFYTTDGSAPTASSTAYTGPITVSRTQTISAIAVAAGFNNSSVASAAYTITIAQPAAATPAFSVPAGSYTSTQTVAISDATAGAAIYYTTNGSAPTTSSTLYAGPITVASTQTISSIATASGFSNSAVASAAYTINQTAVATPVISPATGTYSSAQSVTITDATAGASIYYTTDGSTPTSSSKPYSGPIQVTSTQTISAIAAAGNSTSPVATATITISVGGLKLSGNVFSGTTPVVGAQVQLYAAGQTGYGSAPAPLLGAPSVTDSSGAFTFTYSCPASPGNLVYLVASGGNAGAGSNTKLQLMEALGSCSSAAATASATINEVTTVASVYALAQFAAPNSLGAGILVGTSSGNPSGLASAMKTVSNLADPGTGKALTITPSYKALGSTSGGLLNSSYVPQARIDTLANILNTCVHSNGVSGDCSSLFSAATPASGTAPADSLQAILSIAQHPGSNAATLYGLSPAGAPFQPSLSSAPTDWTLALTFMGGGLGVVPAGDPGNAPSLSSMAIDAAGNIWVTANGACLDPNTFSSVDAIVEFNNQGNALSPAATATNTYCAGYQPKFNGSPVLSFPDSLAVDLNGYLWAGNGGNGSKPFTKLSSDGTVQQANYAAAPNPPNFPGGPTSTTCNAVNSLAIDASNNLWAGCDNGKGTNTGSFDVISATDGSPVGGFTGYGMNNSKLPPDIASLSLDSLGNAWGVTFQNTPVTTSLFQASLGADQVVVANDHSTSGATFVGSVLADGVGNVFSLSATPGSINILAPDQTTIRNFTYPLPSGAVGMQQLALDGAGNLWGAAYSGAVPAPGGFAGDALIPSYLVEMSNTGKIFSPSGADVYGYTGTGGGGETQPILQNNSFYRTSAYAGMAVDGSGNLWIANTAEPFQFDTDVPPGEQLVEFIGIAAPALTPTSVALQNGQIGVRP